MCLFYNAQPSEITGAAKGVFIHSQSSCHIAKVVLVLTAAKFPQRLTRILATHPAVSSIGGLRTPAPVCAAPPSWGRHPQTFTKASVWPSASHFRSTSNNGHHETGPVGP